MSRVMQRRLLILVALAALAGCANENNAIPFDPDTWTLEADARGTPYDGSGRPAPGTR